MNKQDNEKAREIIEEIYPSKSLGDYGLKEQLLLKAMEWKQQQMMNTFKTFVNRKFHKGDAEMLIRDFKKAMEE